MGRPPCVIQKLYPYHLVCRTNNPAIGGIHHFVLMSNHYHIITTAIEENIHRAMQYFNSRVAVRYNKLVGRSGHVWGDRYHAIGVILSTPTSTIWQPTNHLSWPF